MTIMWLSCRRLQTKKKNEEKNTEPEPKEELKKEDEKSKAPVEVQVLSKRDTKEGDKKEARD